MNYLYSLFTATLLVATSFPTLAQGYYRNNTNTAQVQTGNAVYYADYLAGRTTAMGEIYRPEEYTAAHKTYPQGTLLRVTRLDNNKSVVIRVNDRGPYDEGVIIDLSKAAAMDIGLLRDGRAQVRLEVVGQSESNPRRGQFAQQQQQPQAYSNTTYRSSSSSYRSQEYPAAASRSSYRSATSPSSNAYNQTTPDSYSNTRAVPRTNPNSYSRTATDNYRPNNSQRDDQLTARSGYSENLYRQEPEAYNQNSYQQPQAYNQSSGRLDQNYNNRYAPAGESAPSQQRKSPNTTTSYMLPDATKGYAVQLASYQNDENAQRQLEQYQSKGLTDLYIWRKSGYNKIIIAIFPTKTAAQQYLESLRRAYQMDGLVVKVG